MEKKTKPNTEQKHAFTNQKKCTTAQNKHKLKPGSVAFHDIQPGKEQVYSQRKR